MLTSVFRRVNPSRIIHVTTADHGETLGNIQNGLRSRGIRSDVWSWDHVFRAHALPRATWVFTDFDRMAPGPLEIAGKVYKRLKDAGVTVLNDPRRFRNRAQLIAALAAKGINDYSCAIPAAGQWPERYPVFLRTIAAHRGIAGDLLRTPREVAVAIRTALRAGYLLSDLVVVEYCAEPMPETGHFQKHSGLVIGDSIIRANTVNDRTWKAKIGTLGMATDAHYAAERAEYADWPHREFTASVFDLAGMDYGRLDFGIVKGRPQAYEVNTNPTLDLSVEHANADRRASMQLYRDGILDAFAAIATPVKGPDVSLKGLFRLAPRAIIRRPRLF